MTYFDGALSNSQWKLKGQRQRQQKKNVPLRIQVHEKRQKWTKNAISDKLLLNDHQELIAFSVSANSLSTKTTFLESLGATTYACSYLNLAVRQLIKPLHLSKRMCVSGPRPLQLVVCVSSSFDYRAPAHLASHITGIRWRRRGSGDAPRHAAKRGNGIDSLDVEMFSIYLSYRGNILHLLKGV